MKSTLPFSHVTSFRVLAAIVISAMSLHAQSLSIERVQRDFQARHYALKGTYVQWRGCNAANATPAPNFPKDGYYGDLLQNPDKAAQLVQDLVQRFYVSNIIYTAFVKAPNGYADLDGVTAIDPYQESDLEIVSAGDVTAANYAEKLAIVNAQIAKQLLIKVDATQVIASDDTRITQSAYGWGNSSCEEAQWCAGAKHSSTPWGTRKIYGKPQGVPCVSIGQASFPPSWIGRQVEAVVFSNGTQDSYGGTYRNTRGKIYADLRPYTKGTAKVYLQIGAPSTSAVYGGFFTVNGTLEGARPTDRPAGTYGLWAGGELLLGAESTTAAYVTFSDVDLTPSELLSCSYDTITAIGWEVSAAAAIVAPDFTTVPDPGDCCSCSSVCAPDALPDPTLNSVHINIPLGSDNFGGSAGALSIRAEAPSLTLAKIAGLSYTKADSVEKIPSGTPTTQLQLKTSQALFDIRWITDYKYSISVYNAANSGTKDVSGFYQPSGLASSSTVVENPYASPTSYNKLKLTYTKGGSSTVTEYTYTSSNDEWQLTTGSNLRKESQQTTWNNAHTFRTNVITIKSSTDQTVRRETNIYQLFAWGQELVHQTVGSNGVVLVSAWEYYTNPANDGYSRLKQEVDPYGRWVQYSYDSYGREKKRVTQFGDSATGSEDNLNHVETRNYDSSDPQLTIIEQIKGKEISRRYQVVHSGEVQDIVCQTPGANWQISANPDNLVTTTKRYTSGTFKDEVKSIENPDGTMQFYSYDPSGGVRTDTVDSGQPNVGKTAIVDGTRTVTVRGSVGQLISRTVSDIASSITLSSETYSNFDEFNRPRRVTYLDGTYSDTEYGCCGVETTTDRDGVVTQYSHDALKRQDGYTRLGITYQNILDADGRVLVQKRTGADSSIITLSQALYDAAGQVSRETNALGGVTTYSKSLNGSGQRVRTTTFPNAGTRIETYFKDGRLAKLTGTAVFPVRYEYDVETSGADNGRFFTKEIKLQADQTTDSSEWIKTYSDMVGRSYKTLYADSTTLTESDNPFIKSFFNNKGQLAKTVDQDGVTTLYQYNAKGEAEYSATDINPGNTSVDSDGNFPIDLSGDRVIRTVNDVFNNTTLGYHVRRSQSYVYPTDSSSTPLLVSKQETSTDGLHSWQTVYRDASTPVVSAVQTIYNDNDGTTTAGYRTVTTTQPNGSKSVSVFYQGRLLSEARKSSANAQVTKTTYGYDPHGRQGTISDARNGVTTLSYNAADLTTAIVTPNPGTLGSAPQTTTTDYDTSLRAWRVVQPDGASATNEFFLTGLLKKSYGSRTYPVEYTYDYAGRMQTMKTWQDYANGSPSVTTWNYNQYRGWLDNKRYANSTGPDYTYTAGGRLKTRIWARIGTSSQRVSTTYSYGFDDITTGNQHGDLTETSYAHDPQNTPTVTTSYDRRGRATTSTLGSMMISLAYNDADEVLTESYTGGTLNGLTVTSRYDTSLRLDLLTLNSPTALSYTYGYDTASRLSTVSDGTHSATYGYLANSPIVETVTFKQSTTPRLTTTKSYDLLNRLTRISSAPSAASPVSFTYSYNSVNQRTRNTTADGSSWNYEYDRLGQVRRGKKNFNDGEPVPGQQFEYTHDDVGNRKSTKSGGDENGANLRSSSYSPNSLNQYSSRTVPATFDVVGLALGNNATLTVNSLTPWRKGEYFHKELTAANSSSADWKSVTVAATGETAVNGYVFVPATPETLDYDLDGNLTGDGRWTYEWDAENRLKVMRSRAGSPAPERRLVFEYDSGGRRIRKTVWNDRDDGQGSELSDTIFLYDGWNLLEELDANNGNANKNSYLWGTDLSGTWQGVGGVGALLAVKTAANGTHFFAYDGNGNVAALIKASDGVVSANYEYGPFGETVRSTGPMASGNPFLFSTKYQDAETDLLNFGPRYLYTDKGIWLSRDPAEEQGGLNLSAFCRNDPVNAIDGFGQQFVLQIEAVVRPALQFGAEAGTKFGQVGRFGEIGYQSFRIPTELLNKPIVPQPRLGPVGFGTTPPLPWSIDPTLNPQGVPRLDPTGKLTVTKDDEDPPGAFYYRAMVADETGRGPRVGIDRDNLGVRRGVDVKVGLLDLVKPQENGKYQGLSVTPDNPSYMHVTVRPPQLTGPIPREPDGPGRGKQPVWKIRKNEIPGYFGVDDKNAYHHIIYTKECIKFDDFNRLLAETKPFWKKADLNLFIK